MGTTQRIVPGVPGQPNWGDLSKSVTHVAKTVEKEKAEQEHEASKTQEQIAREHNRLIERRAYHVKSAFGNLIKTGGGTKSVTNGKSSSIGRAGQRSSRKLTGFFSRVVSAGLGPALAEIGLTDLKGKSVKDIVDYLIVYCSDNVTGLDETAASIAASEILKEVAIEAGNDLDAFEALLKKLVEGPGISNLLCKFWGLYIFEHLSQRFQEKISQQRGEEISSETFRIIKDDILGQVKLLNDHREVAKVDWKGKDGQTEIEKIFESIIKIITNEASD